MVIKKVNLKQTYEYSIFFRKPFNVFEKLRNATETQVKCSFSLFKPI